MENGIEVIYEDNHLLVAYKPRGILAQADGSNREDILSYLKNYVKEKYHKPGNVYLGLVQRLDTNTAGLMVFARTSKAAKRLSEDIRIHNFEKKYLALAEGKILESGMIESYLSKNEKAKKAYLDPNGKRSYLEYEVVGYDVIAGTEVTKLDISLKTGRFHQIRAQFSSIGHPLFGDTKYGSVNPCDDAAFPLEAYHLGFYHPVSKQWLVFERKTLF